MCQQVCMVQKEYQIHVNVHIKQKERFQTIILLSRQTNFDTNNHV